MRTAILGFLVGVCLLQMQAALPAGAAIVALVAIAMLFLWVSRRLKAVAFAIVLAAIGGIGLGFAWAAWTAQAVLSEQLPSEWEGRDVVLTGVVDSLPYRFEQGVRFGFAVEKACDADDNSAPVPARVALSWYVPRGEDSIPPPMLQPGERWRLRVRLQRPHGNANPDGFDYEVWLLEQSIRATGYVRPGDAGKAENRRIDVFVPGVKNAIERGRALLRDRIEAVLYGKPYAPVIVALVVGDQRAISQSEWKVFSRTGVSHLMSISGLHITMVAGMFAAVVSALWRRSFFTSLQLPLFLPAQKASALAGALAALTYVALAGFGVPAQRTLYMLAVVAAALWFNRIASVSHVLLIALGVVVVFDPWAVMWPGFWLSFGAVAAILYVSVGRAADAGTESSRTNKWKAALGAATRTQYAVTLGLVPLTMLLFAQISLISPLANAVAIPVVSFIVTPLALIGSVMPMPLCEWGLTAAHAVIAWLAALLEWFAGFSWAAWQAPMPSAWMFAAAAAGTLWMLAPRGWPLRRLGACGLLPLVLNAPSHPNAGNFRVTAFDVGQGMALLVETERHRLLYDSGPSYSPDSDGGNRVILPYLKARGIGSLDGMMISHQDNDHSGGALSIIDEIDIDWVSSSLSTSSMLAAKSKRHRRCVAGQQWEWDGVRFEVLHPSEGSYADDSLKPNARSCAVKISDGRHAVLLAGDIESKQEAALVAADAEKLHADVLLAPHHGSGTSSTAAFLAAVKPSVALFQVGYRNRYHHPKPEVYERYGELGIRRMRTDEAGALALQFGSTIDISAYREEHARYWYGK